MSPSAGFPPIAEPDATILILGSLPGQQSLARAEYYAHPANAFWWIMSHLTGAAATLPYPARCAALTASRFALWDVIAAAIRPGSLDASIHRPSVVPNDFATFLAAHPAIRLIAFNGAEAEHQFRARVLPTLAAAAPIARARLLSTSPACTRPRAEKLAQWRLALGSSVIV